MSVDHQKLKDDVVACLGTDKAAGELVDCISSHFPDVEVYRESDDLVIRGGGRFLVVKRTGPEQFRVSENVAVPSTNVVDAGGGFERNLDELIEEITALPT